MTTTLKNNEAFAALLTLEQLNETGKLGYAIAKTRRKLKDELTEYITERDNIIHKYSVLNQEGESILTNDLVQQANMELAPFNELDCTFEPVQIDIETFVSGKLTAQDMYILDFMVKEEEQNEIP